MLQPWAVITSEPAHCSVLATVNCRGTLRYGLRCISSIYYVIIISTEAMDTQEKLEDSRVGIITAKVERSERLCSVERPLEVEIKRTTQNTDVLSRMDDAHAEAELG